MDSASADGPLRIGIGAQVLGKGKGGVETCVAALIGALAELQSPHHFYLYLSPMHPLHAGSLPANFHLRVLPSANPWLERPLWIPLAYRRDGLDVIFLQRALPFWGCPNAVLHLHDAMYATHPELFPSWKRRLLVSIFKRSIRGSAYVVTPSAAAGDDIVRHYDAPPSKIVVVPNAVDAKAFRPAHDPATAREVRARFGLTRPYVACLGAVERNKNLHILIDAFAAFAKEHAEYDLAIVGRWRRETRGGYQQALIAQARGLGLADRVRFTGYVSAEERNIFLANAAMMVFPSVAEGFGLPPLEAMASGVPTVAASIPAVEEVCGDAALLVEPGNVASLNHAMGRLASDVALRNRMIERGRRRAAEFSWERSAEKLLDVLVRTARRRREGR